MAHSDRFAFICKKSGSMDIWQLISDQFSKSSDYEEGGGIVAESLESRILYSASPMDFYTDDRMESERLVLEGSGFEWDDPVACLEVSDFPSDFETEEVPVFLTCLKNLTKAEITGLAETVVDRGKTADLDDGQKDVIEALEISLVDVFSLAESRVYPGRLENPLDTNSNDEWSFSGSTLGAHPEAYPEQIGLDLITWLLPELDGAVRLADLANAQIAKRSVEIGPESESTPLHSLDVETDSLSPVEQDAASIVQVKGACLGFGGKSQLFLDRDFARQLGCVTDSTGLD